MQENKEAHESVKERSIVLYLLCVLMYKRMILFKMLRQYFYLELLISFNKRTFSECHTFYYLYSCNDTLPKYKQLTSMRANIREF